MIVVTWNVLHRIHAVNWDEPAIRAWADERDRIASISDFLAPLDADVICLQEVSGDQLAMLRDVVDGDVFAAPYPRVPAYYRRFEAPKLRDPSEHLVTIVRAPGATLVGAEPFATDPGKGFLQVALASGAHVINTHVSWGDKHAAQCARIAEVAAAADHAVVCGDFNDARERCAARLGEAFAPAIPAEPALPTRPRPAPPRTSPPSAKPETIDHVFVRELDAVAAEVLDGYGRSDHNPVAARLAPLTRS